MDASPFVMTTFSMICMKKFLKRLFSFLVIYIPFASYVYLIQVAYDSTQVKTDPLSKAVLFLIALLAGCITYDCAKHSFFMRDQQFEKFFSKLLEAWGAVLFVLAACVASAVFSNMRDTFPVWLGVGTYLIALGSTYWIVSATSDAIEIGASEENSKKGSKAKGKGTH